MAESTNWAFRPELQPSPDEARFDLAAAFDSVLMVRAEIPEDAFTASILGIERVGNGIVIGQDGLVLTIGYLITEAHTIWLTTNRGAVVAGHTLAYDQVTGFGLVQPLGKLDLPVLRRGSAKPSGIGDEVIVIGHGGRSHSMKAKIIAKREFAGYWEYLLEEAVFTAPAHPQWGGAAVVDADGQLIGIGSLLVQEAVGDQEVQGNMSVPVDLLEPILDDLLSLGRVSRPSRPWLGIYATEAEGQVVVGGLAGGGPGDKSGVLPGDLVLEVGGHRVATLADLLRTVWRQGPAGTEIPLTLAREGELVRIRLQSADRSDFLKKPRLH